MELRKLEATVFGKSCNIEVMDFTPADGTEWKRIFDLWRGLKMGMRDYKSREPNFLGSFFEVTFIYLYAKYVL